MLEMSLFKVRKFREKYILRLRVRTTRNVITYMGHFITSSLRITGSTCGALFLAGFLIS
jgi:hypothetical protein